MVTSGDLMLVHSIAYKSYYMNGTVARIIALVDYKYRLLQFIFLMGGILNSVSGWISIKIIF